jgi:ribosomal protein S18 acetylase RimI-like enzyme
MNKKITENLFELWTYVGQQTGLLLESSSYKAIMVHDSEWPKRVYSFENDDAIYKAIFQISQNKLPEIVTVSKTSPLGNDKQAQLLFVQKNMALFFDRYQVAENVDQNIREVRTRDDAELFALCASKAFAYKIDSEIIFKTSQKPQKAKLFFYNQKNIAMACGMIFFDSNNNAGLHMIATLPEGRGRGIGKSMTEKLLLEAKRRVCKCCVLQASQMGEGIYKRLGFAAYGELETYRILK